MTRPQLAFRHSVSASTGALEIDVYDAIGETWDGEGVTAKGVRDLLKQANAKTIALRINSMGGDAFDGVAIHNLLREQAERGASVTCRIDGVAASAASVIAAACDEVTIPANAAIMIHEAWMLAMGGADDLEKKASMLRQVNGSIADTYSAAAARRGVTKSREDCLAAMANETWLFGEEAVAFGLADKCAEPMKAAASLDLSMFRRGPEMAARLTPAPRAENRDPSMSDLLKELGAADEAQALGIVEQIRAELTDVRTALPEVQAKASALAALETEIGASGEAAVGVIKALRAKAEAADAVSTELAAAQAKLAEIEAQTAAQAHASLVAKALEDGALTPAMKAWADGVSTETLRAFLAVAPKAIPGAGAPPPTQPKTDSAVALTDDDRAVAACLGITPEAFAAAKAAKTITSNSDVED